jgi:hypothetical protein
MSYLDIALRAKRNASVQRREISAQSEITKTNSDTSEPEHIQENRIIHDSEGRNHAREGRIMEQNHIPPVSKVPGVAPIPNGIRLIRWESKTAPVAIDVCSVVVDVPKFIESELRALDSRLNNPGTIRGGFTVWQMLDRLAQAGLIVELEPKGRANE